MTTPTEKKKPHLRKLVGWAAIFLLAMLIGSLAFAYTYITDSDTLVALVNAHLPRFLPGSRLRVERAQLRPLIGQFDITQATLYQTVDGKPFPVGRFPWIQVKCDLQKLGKGLVEPREVTIAQPSLRIVRRKNGSWNLQGLLADPWPTTHDIQPIIRVSRGIVELVDEDSQITMIVHDVDLTLEPIGEAGLFHLQGSAQGGFFDRIQINGTLNAHSGRIALDRASVSALDLSEKLRVHLPDDWTAALDDIGLNSGIVDIEANQIDWDGNKVAHHSFELSIHDGTWTGPLPWPLGDVAGAARVENGHAQLEWLEGRYGKTRVRIHGALFDLNAPDPLLAPMTVELSVVDLELDSRLKSTLPDDLRALWDDFAPPATDALGRISLRAKIGRSEPNAPLTHEVAFDLIDVALQYRSFPFPLEHLRGRVVCKGNNLTIERVETLVGNQPFTAEGTIHNLGPDPAIDLQLTAGSLPLGDDSPFLAALPDDLKALVASFHPTGSIRGTARVTRQPAAAAAIEVPPWEQVRIDASVELNEGCAIRWDGLPYPLRRLTGKLECHPNVCIFTDMQCENNMARINGSGRVELIEPGRFAADLAIQAERLPFDQQLRDALPSEWKATWGLLNPVGTSSVDAHIVAGWTDRPDRTQLTIRIDREDEARVKLRLLPVAGTPGVAPGQAIEMPAMQDVRGQFQFDNGVVTVSDVAFSFREAPVQVRGGRVHLRDTGQFDLRIEDMQVSRLRLDSELRRIMPPLMAEFARRLDEGKPFSFGGNLSIGWSGLHDDPAVCTWDDGRIYFQNNALAAGLAVEQIQGQMTDISGRSDGRGLTLAGLLEFDSFIVAGQQIAMLRTPLTVGEGKAELPEITAKFLGGTLQGQAELSLAATPEYRAWARVENADLSYFTQTIPGRQDLAGKVSGSIEINGVGSDLRRLNGTGEASLRDGDLGKLPWFVRLITPLELARDGKKPAFDRADLAFTIKDGQAQLNPIRIVGDTLTFHGAGTISPQADVDFEFTPLYGRGERARFGAVGGAAREASNQVLLITVRGPLGGPRVGVTVLPGPTRRVLELVRGFTGNDRPSVGPPSPPRRRFEMPLSKLRR